MPEPYVGEIRMFAGNFAPNGWMFCEGQTLPISENEVLFNLPNLASRVPIHMGTGPDGTTYQIGEMAGTEQETLTTQQIPNHNHSLLASQDNAGGSAILGNVTGQVGASQIYREVAPASLMAPSAIGPAGGSQPHENTQPFLCINFIISLFGVFPSQT